MYIYIYYIYVCSMYIFVYNIGCLSSCVYWVGFATAMAFKIPSVGGSPTRPSVGGSPTSGG